MSPLILLGLKVSIVLMVFSIGLKATAAQAGYLLHRPGELLRAAAAMNVVMPALALAIAIGLDTLHPAVRIALVVVSVSPAPPVFPNRAFKAGGSREYVIGLETASALLAIVTIPLSMEVFQRASGVPLAMGARDVALLAGMTILAPLLAGIAVARMAPGFTARFAGRLTRTATALLALLMLPVLVVVARPLWSLVADGAVAAIAGFAATGVVTGHVAGRHDPRNRPVLALATITRHPGIAIAIAHANFPEQRLAVAAVLLYVLLSAVVSSLYLTWVRPHHTDDRTIIDAALRPAAHPTVGPSGGHSAS